MKKLSVLSISAFILLLVAFSVSAYAASDSEIMSNAVNESQTSSEDSYYMESDNRIEPGFTYFEDVSDSAWYADCVRYVYKNHLMNGVGGNLFDPEGTVTRGMLVTILYRREGEPEVATQSLFEDVLAGSYCERAVTWAADKGIVNGYSTTHFGPGDTITREQIATILHRYTTYKGYQTNHLSDLSGYTDADNISSYAANATYWAVGMGLINGMTPTTLLPKGLATRAQTAAIIMRYDSKTDMSGNIIQQPSDFSDKNSGEASGQSPDEAIIAHPAGDDPENVTDTDAESPSYGPYIVVFQDYNGMVLKAETVADSRDATPPPDPTREGYAFVGWDDSYLCILSDKTLTAQYLQTDFPYRQPASSSTGEPTSSSNGNGENISSTEGPPSDDSTTPGMDAAVGTLEWPDDNGILSPAILVGIVGARAGDSDVTVPIIIRHNPGILGMTLSLLYDETTLELIEAVNGSAMDGILNLTTPGRYVSQCRFIWDGQDLAAEDIVDGEILVLRFRVSNHAARGTYPITVFYNGSDIIDNNLMPVNMTMYGGSVRVVQ